MKYSECQSTRLSLRNGAGRRDSCTPDARDEIVRPFVPVIKSIAIRVRGAVPENWLCGPDSLLAAGIAALSEAANSYRRQAEIPFSLYVRSRIRGEMLDSARQRSARLGLRADAGANW